MNEWAVLAAAGLWGVSGLPGLFLSPESNRGQRWAALLGVAGSLLGLAAALRALLPGAAGGSGLALPLAVLEETLSLRVDPLSALFLLPVFLIAGLGAVFSLEYWRQSEHPRNGRKMRLFYGLLTAGLILVVAARSGLLFLFGWEVMALSAFFVVTTEDEKPEVREAGWVYFVATHLSTLLLFAFFGLYYSLTGSLTLEPLAPGAVSPGAADGLFLLALCGFGIKAGLFPLHFWLPPAHSSAPSHVSALMSGVLIKMGVYGVVRVLWIFPEVPLWWGGLLLALGGVSGVVGVAFALGQHDLKRLLAYHSIENIGIIFLGLGLALAGRALGRADWMALGLAGALLHVLNHGLFKALLFLAAGSAIHAAGTREIDQLGGLARAMPLTGFAFLMGALAICGLPPLNGFVSELLIYLGLFRSLTPAEGAAWAPATAAIPVLALIGGLALACFVKVHGAVFLGMPRSEGALRAAESGPAMIAPLGVLTACCFFIGLCPPAVAPLLEPAVRSWSRPGPAVGPPLAELAPLGWIAALGTALLAALPLAAFFLRRRSRASAGEGLPTWDCGYAKPSPSMQYTGSSFAQTLVGLLRWLLLPESHGTGPGELFPERSSFRSHVPDLVLERALLPAFRSIAWACSWFRLLQRGRINAYLFYIFLTLLILLLWR
jgi:hydrogenase-4 component B